MPIVDNKEMSPDEAILLGRCPECGQLLIPKTAVAHASSHWFGRDPNDPWLSAEARRRYKLIIDFAAARYNPALEERQSYRQGNLTQINVERDVPTNDKAVLGFCELWALFFGLPAGEALYRGEPFTGRMIVFIAIASVFAVIGPIWPSIKSRMPRRFAAHFVRAASDFRWWMVILLVGFAYLTLPTIAANFRSSESYGIEGYIGGGGPPQMPGGGPPQMASRSISVASPGDTPTKLQIQYNELGKPQVITKMNVANYVSVNSISRAMMKDSEGRPVSNQVFTNAVYLFVVFDKPIAAKDFRIDGNGAMLPMHQIEDKTSRSALIVFDGPIVGTVVNVQAVF